MITENWNAIVQKYKVETTFLKGNKTLIHKALKYLIHMKVKEGNSNMLQRNSSEDFPKKEKEATN